MKVAREFHFDAGHYVLDAKGGPCEEPHGHTYKLRVVVEGPVGKDGMVVDFRDMKEVVSREIMPRLDHKDLNKVFKNPTAELIAQWIFDTLSPAFAKVRPGLLLVSVRLWEGEGKWAEVERKH